MISEPFLIASRYYGIETATWQPASARTVVYLRRRFIPPREQFQFIEEYTVTEGDRLDNITAHYLGDPEQFWRLCDANNAMQPNELTDVIGRRLGIPLI